jgi:AraC-like DNA-binding protein
MAVVPMTYATGFGSLPDLLEAEAGSKALIRAFAEENLPLALVSDRVHRIPLASMVGLFDRAARLSGDTMFGLKVGLAMEPGEYGRWIAYALQGETLLDALTRMSRCLTLHQVGGGFSLDPRGGERVIWTYRQSALSGSADRQHADHVIPPQIRIAQAYCGRLFKPCWIETVHPDPGDASEREKATGAPWRFGRAATGIVFPAAALRARRVDHAGAGKRPAICSLEIRDEIRLRSQERPVERIAAILSLRLLDGKTDIDGAARMSRLGRRTLQRALDREAITYRALLERVRMTRARALIVETGTPLTEIALDVGYSDAAHFTRAYKRHFGEPPSALRRCQTAAAPR